MKQSRHLNPSEETGTGFLVTSKYVRTTTNMHGGVYRLEHNDITRLSSSWAKFVNITN